MVSVRMLRSVLIVVAVFALTLFACKNKNSDNESSQGDPVVPYASEFKAIEVDPGASTEQKLAVQACAGLYNRELGGSIYVRGFTAASRLEILERYFSFDAKTNEAVPKDGSKAAFELSLAVAKASVCDKSGKLLATGKDGEKILGELDANLLDRISTAAMELNGLSGQEELAKNSPSPDDASPSN